MNLIQNAKNIRQMGLLPLLIQEKRLADETLLYWVVEAMDGRSDIAEGIETLRDGGNSEIRDRLRAAAIERLEKTYGAKLESIFPSEGIELPDADSVSLGSYRDTIGTI